MSETIPALLFAQPINPVALYRAAAEQIDAGGQESIDTLVAALRGQGANQQANLLAQVARMAADLPLDCVSDSADDGTVVLAPLFLPLTARLTAGTTPAPFQLTENETDYLEEALEVSCGNQIAFRCCPSPIPTRALLYDPLADPAARRALWKSVGAILGDGNYPALPYAAGWDSPAVKFNHHPVPETFHTTLLPVYGALKPDADGEFWQVLERLRQPEAGWRGAWLEIAKAIVSTFCASASLSCDGGPYFAEEHGVLAARSLSSVLVTWLDIMRRNCNLAEDDPIECRGAVAAERLGVLGARLSATRGEHQLWTLDARLCGVPEEIPLLSQAVNATLSASHGAFIQQAPPG